MSRIEELEQRVAALERAAAPPVAATTTDVDGRFWVLDGLRPQAVGRGAVTYAGSVEPHPGERYEWQMSHHVDDLLDLDDDARDRLAHTLAALGHPVRLAVLAAVLDGTTKTAELGERADLATSGQVYHHVRALTSAGWLKAAGRGHVTVPPERVVPLLVALGVAS
ncbi:MAG: helix-turn-helix domain-containing protein [Nocardioidaceae bacterium]|nr:helix-turn-helix domain-containing protein [Nocardioidaceae bacterium]